MKPVGREVSSDLLDNGIVRLGDLCKVYLKL